MLIDCGMEMEAKASSKKKNCCKDEVQKIEGQDELQLTSFDKISFEKQQFLVAFIFLTMISSMKIYQKN